MRKATRALPADGYRLLLDIDQAIQGIRYPVDSSDLFHSQVQHALTAAGLNVTREVLMSRQRRIDLVVVRRNTVVAIELEWDRVPEDTVAKFRDLPRSVLRVAVLRQWPYRPPVVPHTDRVVCVTSDLRCIPWLVDGSAILEEAATRGPTRELQRHVMADRAAEAAAARRLILGRR